MDINKIIFSRVAASKKVEIVKNLTTSELLSISPATISRMVKETGTRLYKSRDKQLRLSNHVGNDWNAWITSVRNYGINPLAEIYIQYENTDTDTVVSFYELLKKGEYRGSVILDDRYGNARHYYFTFSESQKGECVKELLLTYLQNKYHL